MKPQNLHFKHWTRSSNLLHQTSCTVPQDVGQRHLYDRSRLTRAVHWLDRSSDIIIRSLRLSQSIVRSLSFLVSSAAVSAMPALTVVVVAALGLLMVVMTGRHVLLGRTLLGRTPMMTRRFPSSTPTVVVVTFRLFVGWKHPFSTRQINYKYRALVVLG